ncbi:MAG: hypothetical protein M1608_01545, partial [Candidatus Omnitrophica bacterium]|nr:hypothetical protein [Candidatus Omnitrophota bacterium]
ALRSGVCGQSNQWQFWLLPVKKRNLPVIRVVNLTGEAQLDTRYSAEAAHSLEGAEVTLATKITPGLLTWVMKGGSVVLLEPNQGSSSGLLSEYGMLTYWPLWLRCDAQIVERHPALGDFPHEGFSGFQFMRLFGSAVPAVDFTPRNSVARNHVLPIVWGLSLVPWKEDAARFGYALAYRSPLSECRVGKGRAIICNLWVLDGLRRGYPEARYLLDCLVDYAAAETPTLKFPALSAEDAGALFRVESSSAR